MVILAAVLFLSVGACVYLGATHPNGHMHSVTPMQGMYLLMSICFSLFYVSALQTFLVAVTCWARAPGSLV